VENKSLSPHIIRLKMGNLKGCFPHATDAGRDILWLIMETDIHAGTVASQNIKLRRIPDKKIQGMRRSTPQMEGVSLIGKTVSPLLPTGEL
jgi:hypothetical protein